MNDPIPFEEYLKLENHRNLFRNVEFFISGRAPYSMAKMLDDYFPRISARQLCSTSCSQPFLREWHNHFDNYGNYMPGFCGGISLGDVHRLDRLVADGINTEKKPVLGFMARGDFAGLLDFANQQGYEEVAEGYFSKCHLCLDIRLHLVTTGTFEELAPPDFDSEISASEYDTEFVLEEESETLGSVLKDLGWDQEED